MNKKGRLSSIIALVLTFAVFGGLIAAIEPVEAKSDKRSLAGRAFAIEGEWLASVPGFNLPPVGFTFENCYTFNADGTWVDPLFLAPSFWIQHTAGRTISYTAIGDGSAFGAILTQNGTVKSGRHNDDDSDSDSDSDSDGKRKARLTAYSTLYFLGGLVAGEIVSRGHEVDSCDP